MIGSRFYGVRWFGTQTIASAIFGLPLGFLVIWIVSLMTAPPPQAVQDLVVSVRYPKSGQMVKGDPLGRDVPRRTRSAPEARRAGTVTPCRPPRVTASMNDILYRLLVARLVRRLHGRDLPRPPHGGRALQPEPRTAVSLWFFGVRHRAR